MPNRHSFISSEPAQGAAPDTASVFRSGCLRAAAFLWLALASPARADYTAFVDPTVVVVTNFEGWGTSLCWWANVVGGYSNRETYADLAFSQLKLNIVRYNIGGGENPTNHFMQFRAQMPGFEPTNGVWNWSADANQRWMLQAALARGVDHVEAFANSPPWWMTVSGSVTGSTNGTSNNLQTNFEQSFALYLAMVVSNLTVVDGVHFDIVTPMNEPNEDWWVYGGSQEGCYMSTAQQVRMVNDLRAELDALGQSAGVAACEDSYEEDTLNSLNAYGAPALSNVSRIVTHTYSANAPDGLRNLAASLHKPLWVSEYGHCDATGMNQARRIHDDIAMMGARAWVYWQVVDGDTCWGPLYNPEVASTNSDFTTNYTIQETFYVIGQFSEFIRPGCQILSVGDANSLAAYNPTNSTLVIVTVNDTTNTFNITYDLSAFSGLPAQVSLSRTSGSENMAALAPLPVNNHRFTSAILAQSVTTHILTNVAPAPALPYEGLIMADAPVCYWRLNETNGSIAYEAIAELNGTYGTNTTNGVSGVSDPPFYGFPSNNFAVAMDPNVATAGAGYVTAPALNLNTNTVTITAWVYPFTSIAAYDGVVFTRASTYSKGINYVAEASRLNMIGYTWNENNINTYGWASGLVTPPRQWSFVALTIAPTQAVIYVGANGVLLSATNAIAHDVEAWNGGTLLGADTVSLPSRIFDGKLDQVAVFDYTLSPAQIAQLYATAFTGGPVIQDVAWGDNTFGQGNASGISTNLIAIAAGAWHNLGLGADGTVVAWGYDADGQCDVPLTLQSALAIAGGGYHSLALQADGTVAAWGADDSGQTNVPAGLANVIGISAGTWHSVALRRDGTVVVWGDNSFGQTNPPAGLTNVIAVAAGGSHTLALTADGTVVAWGENTDAEGNEAGQSVVPLGLTNVVAIGAGEYHSLAVRADGTVAAWGDDSDGQCDVPAGLSNVVAVAGGGAHSLAVRADGTVAAWGDNDNGQCSVPSGLSDVVGIGAGEYHSLALLVSSIPVPQLLNPARQGSRFSALAQTLNRKNYALDCKNSLAATNWNALSTNTGNGALRMLTDPAATGAQRFYRMRQW
jgi:O-glycosyl hydrolase